MWEINRLLGPSKHLQNGLKQQQKKNLSSLWFTRNMTCYRAAASQECSSALVFSTASKINATSILSFLNRTSSIPSFNFHFFICSFISSSVHLFSWPVSITFCQNLWKLCISPFGSSISVITLIRSKGFCLFLCSFVSHKPFIRFLTKLGQVKRLNTTLPVCIQFLLRL